MSSSCVICQNELKGNQAILECSTCPEKFCLLCVFPGLKNSGVLRQIAANFEASKHVVFSCLTCVKNGPKNAQNLSDIADKVANLESQITAISSVPIDKVDKLKSVLNSLDEIPEMSKINGSIQTVEKSLSSFQANLENSWAQVAGKNCPKQPNFEKAISDAINKSKVQENCEKSLVISGIKEPTKTDGNRLSEAAIAEQDNNTVAELFRDMGLGHVKPERVFRCNPTKTLSATPPPRKLKVVLAGHHEQKLVLQEKRVLKEYDQWDRVSIEPSRPLEDRIADSVLKSQGRIMNEKMHGKKWEELQPELDNVVEMVKFSYGKLWHSRRDSPGEKWRKIRAVREEELPPPPPPPGKPRRNF